MPGCKTWMSSRTGPDCSTTVVEAARSPRLAKDFSSSTDGLRVELARVGQRPLELPRLVDRKHHIRAILLQDCDLLRSCLRWLLVEIGLVQHRDPLADGVAGDQGNVLIGHPHVMQLRGKGMPESVEPDAFRKAEILHVSAELIEHALAVTGVGVAIVASHAGRQVWEEARMAASSDVLDESQEPRIE